MSIGQKGQVGFWWICTVLLLPGHLQSCCLLFLDFSILSTHCTSHSPVGFQVAIKLMRNASGRCAQTKTAQSRQHTSNSLVANGPHSGRRGQHSYVRSHSKTEVTERDDLMSHVQVLI